MNFKKISAFLLALVMVLSFAACSNNESAETTDPETTAPATTVPEAVYEGPMLTDLYMSMGLNEVYNTMSVFVYEEGDVSVEYSGAVRKVGSMDKAFVEALSAKFAASGLMELNGTEEYGESLDSLSVTASFDDGSSISISYYGSEIPEAAVTAYNAVDAAMQELLADMPEYVPQPLVMGEIAEADRAAIDGILEHIELENPEAYAINGLPMDEYFASAVGLSDVTNVVSGVQFMSMMMGGEAYALNIVSVADGASEAVCADFENSIDWLKWVCVQPSDALIATNGNHVLCLMATGDTFTMTKTAIETAGWTVVTGLTNPNL